jgi:signal-transduction protein with cAMP-binding, CBS, and nucleotidyltransferase domain
MAVSVLRLRPVLARAAAQQAPRAFSAVPTSPLDFQPIPEPELNPLYETAQSALNKSCYLNIDWQIKESDSVATAVKRMVAHDIGALAVTSDTDGTVLGVVSERDYLNKVAFLDKSPGDTKVAEVATMGVANLVSVTRGNPIDKCMEKMLAREIRHLMVREKETSEIVGMISIKDIVKCAHLKHKAQLDRLEDIIVNQELVNSPY